jgi:antitoxin VapB
MHLNIKNDRAHELATELAKITGESLTGAVTRALEERLARERKQRSVEEKVRAAMAIVHAAGGGSGHSGDHDQLLYDERGLPREW